MVSNYIPSISATPNSVDENLLHNAANDAGMRSFSLTNTQTTGNSDLENDGPYGAFSNPLAGVYRASTARGRGEDTRPLATRPRQIVNQVHASAATVQPRTTKVHEHARIDCFDPLTHRENPAKETNWEV